MPIMHPYWLSNLRNQLHVKQLCLPSIISNVTKKKKCWKTVRLTSFKNRNSNSFFKSSSSLSIRATFCICCDIYTLFYCFKRLFLCFTKFGGSYHSLNFDKFRDTASLLINNYSMSAHWIWDGWKPTRRVARSGITVLLKTPTKYREFFPTILVKTTDFQLVFNFEQMCTVTTCGEHGIMAHTPWWLSQSEL